MKDEMLMPWVKVYYAFGRNFRWNDVDKLPWFDIRTTMRYVDNRMVECGYMTGSYFTTYSFTDKFIKEVINER